MSSLARVAFILLDRPVRILGLCIFRPWCVLDRFKPWARRSAKRSRAWDRLDRFRHRAFDVSIGFVAERMARLEEAAGRR